MEKYRDKIYKNYYTVQWGNYIKLGNIEKEYEIQSRYFKRNYLNLIGNDKNIKILDAGCGLGHFLYFLKKQGFSNAVGIDISVELVEYCRGKGFASEQHEIHSYLRNNPDTFNVIVFNDVIEHLDKQEAFDVLCEMLASLKQGGTLIIKTPNMTNPITAPAGRYIDFTHETGFTESSLSEVLLAAGFKDVTVKGTDIYVFYYNPFNYIAKLGAFIMNGILYFLSYMYGRKTMKIYEKDIIAAAKK